MLTETIKRTKDLMGKSWFDVLKPEKILDKIYKKLDAKFIARKPILPKANQIYRAYKLCPFNSTRVVIIGQDPYHTPGVADGLAFSSGSSKTPPSLLNIFKEIHSNLYDKEDFEKCFPTNNLMSWALQGVLLLNSALTVEAHSPKSHSDLGWHNLVKRTIEVLDGRNVIFLLWGRDAKMFSPEKSICLTSAHPSPLSVRGFAGNKHFSKVNSLLEKPIDWRTYVMD